MVHTWSALAVFVGRTAFLTTGAAGAAPGRAAGIGSVNGDADGCRNIDRAAGGAAAFAGATKSAEALGDQAWLEAQASVSALTALRQRITSNQQIGQYSPRLLQGWCAMRPAQAKDRQT